MERHPPPGANAPPRPRYSITAITGLVLAAVPCCPFAGMLGAMLGIIALLRIRQSGGLIRGKRVAMAAVVAGVASSLVWSVVGQRFVEQQESAYRAVMQDQIARVMDAAANGDPSEIASLWAFDAPAPDAAIVETFGEAVAGRYGAFERMSIISSSRSGPMLSPVMETAGVLHFERATPLGSARFRTKVVPGQWFAQLRLISLKIEDAGAGDLVLGEAPPASVAP